MVALCMRCTRTLRSGTDQEDQECLTLALWLNIKGKPQKIVYAARELLVEIMDEWMSRSQGVQGLMGQWPSIRIRLRSGLSLNNLEAALANVLPSESDWQQWMETKW